MARLVWDKIGEKFFEAGVDHGVLYIPDAQGDYVDGVAWNGLTAVTESPSGADANPQYADNIKYLNIRSAEMFGGTIEAYTYPDEFAQFDGQVTPTPGVVVAQQTRKRFGLSYRTGLGNDLDEGLGYKLHLAYGATANPSQKAYSTINDSPDGLKFSWDFTTDPVALDTLVNGKPLKPTALLTVNSVEVNPVTLAALEQILYGTAGVDPALPMPDTVITMFAGGVVVVHPAVPAYNAATHTITIPAVAGVSYYIDGDVVPTGPVVIAEDTLVEARPNAGNVFGAGDDNDWEYIF